MKPCEVKTEESIIIVEKHELVSLDGTDKAIETALDGTETKALAVLESKKLEEPTASLDHNKLPDFNELKKGKRVIGIENIIKGIIFQITYSCFFPNRKGGR